MVGDLTSGLSLIELYGNSEVNSVSKFAGIAEILDPSGLVRKYKELNEVAPKRHDTGKEYFVGHDLFVGSSSNSNRKEEHLAGALFNNCREGKIFSLPEGEKLNIIDYQFPLKARQGDKGIGKVDLIGVIDEETPCVIELKVDQDSGTKPDTPLRALLEGLAYCAIIETNQKEIWQESQEKFGLRYKGPRPDLMVLAPDKYWNYYFENKSAGDWPISVISLANKVSELLDIRIHFYSLTNSEFEWGGNAKPAKLKSECRFIPIEPLK
jgi:hypothetical protein